jgi:hypothetical protein
MRPTRPVLLSTAVGKYRAVQYVGKKIVVPGFVRGCSRWRFTVVPSSYRYGFVRNVFYFKM